MITEFMRNHPAVGWVVCAIVWVAFIAHGCIIIRRRSKCAVKQ